MNTPKTIQEIHESIQIIKDKNEVIYNWVQQIHEQMIEIKDYMQVAAFKKKQRQEILQKARAKRNKSKK
jgi:hypothetical protein